MPRVTSADEATDIAMQLVKKNRPFAGRPLKAYEQDGVWIVEIDVGLFEIRVGQVRVNAETGDILDYQLP